MVGRMQMHLLLSLLRQNGRLQCMDLDLTLEGGSKRRVSLGFVVQQISADRENIARYDVSV